MDLYEGPFERLAREAWGQERTIRAWLLRQLLFGQLGPVHARGVRLRGVLISGQLDLAEASLRWPLHLTDCYLDEAAPVVLDRAIVSLLTFNGCYLAGLEGDSLTVTKDLDLRGSTFAGPLRLPNADVNPRLHLAMHQVVANQLLAGDPPETWRTVQHLAGLGYDWHNIMHMIASQVVMRLLSPVKAGTPEHISPSLRLG
jgi:hypothetical protein